MHEVEVANLTLVRAVPAGRPGRGSSARLSQQPGRFGGRAKLVGDPGLASLEPNRR